MSRKGKSKMQRVCQVCGEHRHSMLHPGALVRPAIVELIKPNVEGWSEDSWICTKDLNRFRHDYVRSLIHNEMGELTSIEDEVLESLSQQEVLSKNPDTEDAPSNLGQRLADRIAEVGGSWSFIIGFGTVLILWVTLNTVFLASRAFDPYPYILLNLFLSCLAAVQAPVIMMSQNRQESRDRQRAIRDYQINLKAELEIRQLHQKMDHLLFVQWERLVELQDEQTETLVEKGTDRSKPS